MFWPVLVCAVAASILGLLISVNMASHDHAKQIDVLARVGGAQISTQMQNPARVQATLEGLVASDDLVGARVTRPGGADIVTGQVDGENLAVVASLPLGRSVNDSVETLGTLTLYGVLNTDRIHTLFVPLLIVWGTITCLLLIMLALYFFLNRSVLRPLAEIGQGLSSAAAQPDFVVRFSKSSQTHMIEPLRDVASALDALRNRLSTLEGGAQQQQNRAARTIEIAQLGYAKLDLDQRRFTECDPTYAAMLDREVHEVLHSDTLPTLVSKQLVDFDEAENQIRREAIRQGKTLDETHRIIRRNGDIRYIRVILRPVPVKGTYGSVVELVGQDITDLRLNEIRAAQTDRISTIGNLTGGIAHDFNNLLAIVSGNIELAALATSKNEQAEYIDNALAAVARGASLTQQLLAFARNQPLSPKIIGAQKLVTDMLPRMRSALGARVSIAIQDAPDLWPIHADAAKLDACLMNLVSNAADAMPDGGTLTISLANREIDAFQARQMAGAEPGEYVCIELADTGIGMSRAVAAKAFDPFFTTKNIGKGTGMGLSMVQGFAQQSGGFTALHTIHGQGTAVRVFMPRADSGTASKASGLDQTAANSARLKGCHVLLIEDEDQLRMLYTTKLEAFGCKVTQAATGEKALELARSMTAPQIILSDIIMPGGMNGVETVDALAKYFPDATVVFISGFSQNAAMHNGLLSIGRVLLQKPFTRAKLEATLIDAISSKTTHGKMPEGPND
tara:strand:+ start:130 stop:2334 length:2205 start_codon:yes stop_codon:yes gene_type:complete